MISIAITAHPVDVELQKLLGIYDSCRVKGKNVHFVIDSLMQCGFTDVHSHYDKDFEQLTIHCKGDPSMPRVPITSNFSFRVDSDLFTLGRDDDGDEIYGHSLYVIAEDANGRRFKSRRQWPTLVRDKGANPERGLVPKMIETEAYAGCREFEGKWSCDYPENWLLDDHNWVEVDPAYGSEAYQRFHHF